MFVGKVVRQSRAKGVLIRSGIGVNKWSGKLLETERFGSILLASWSESGVCGLGMGITVVLHDGSGVARHKQE